MGGQAWATDDELARLRRSFTLADLAPLAAEAGVTGTVVIQTAAEPWETPDLLALAAGRDPYAAGGRARGDGSPGPGPAGSAGDGAAAAVGLLAGVVGWIDLAAPAVADAVAGLRALPGGEFLCGIRHPVLAERDPGWLARPTVLRGLHALAAEGLGFDLVTLPHQLPAAVTAARPPGRAAGRPGPGGHGRAVGLGDPWPGGAAQRDVQAVRRAHQPGPRQRAASLLRDGAGRLRPGPAHVRLRLAGLYARRDLPPGMRRVPGAHRRAERRGTQRDL